MRAGFSAALLTAVLASGVMAAHVETYHDRFDNTFPATVCGVDVTIHETGVVNGNLKTDRQGHVLSQSTFNYYATWTNGAGAWISLSFHGLTKDISVVDNPDGGYTVTFAFVGVPMWFRDSSGRTITKDAGRIVVADTIDANGEFVSRSVVSEAGPHPFFESGDDCQIVADYLT